ncbi:transposase [Hyphomicrobium sp. 1Nfss2.1]|uniref:transposase n=1 Tax=Hyphomicrobium sp. 1Nfss2.1 TaxID=3413936 RepID=UPI003C7D87E9
MSVPGIGALSVLACINTVEEPMRFSRSRSVGALLGLTRRQYQSGETDRSGRISRCGDHLARTLMYEAAVVILTRVKRAPRCSRIGLSHCKAIGLRQGARRTRTQANRYPSQHQEIWRALPVVRVSHAGVTTILLPDITAG